MLNMAKVEFELISDPDIYFFLSEWYERYSFLYLQKM